MIAITLNDQSPEEVSSIERLGVLLDQANQIEQFELWVSSPLGQSLCMLRNGPNAWLMYLRHEGDSGFSSRGQTDRHGVASYTLSNGQVDEYPLSWCIEVEQCYKSIAFFFVNNGSKPEWVAWNED